MHPRPNTIERVDPDEEKLIEVHKHPFGILIVYVQAVIALVTVAVIVFFALPSIIEDPDTGVLVATGFIAFAVVVAGVILAVSTYVYRQNRVIVTDRNITQILQFGLFSRKVSQLNIVNVEDVTSVQHGLISTAFNFGVLRIETAGEQANFNFTFCPNSGLVAKLILDAREKMLGQMDDDSPVDVKHEVRKNQARPRRYSAKRAKKQKKANREPNVHSIGAEIVDHALDKKK